MTKHQHSELDTIRKLYEQQSDISETKTHSVPKPRIVSISQPHIRPIVNGKAGTDVEFGCKVMTSVMGGYTFIEKLDFENFNEGTLL